VRRSIGSNEALYEKDWEKTKNALIRLEYNGLVSEMEEVDRMCDRLLIKLERK
jgi:hypothetical protein